MAILLSELKLPLSADESSLPSLAARALNVHPASILSHTVKRVSLDARKMNDIHFVYTLIVELSKDDEAFVLKKASNHVTKYECKNEEEVASGTERLLKPIVIVGYGPAGIFAAYTLAKYGYKPIIIERGSRMDKRTVEVDAFWTKGVLNEDSNTVFGEGGAGTFSDGKLTTRIKDSRANSVISLLADMGAPDEIRYMAKPHIGTDVLKPTVENIRNETIRMGAEIRFNTKLVGLKVKNNELCSVVVASQNKTEEILVSACILAIGHGAGDTYRMLDAHNVMMQAKPFAIGVRIEHPRELIDRSQYGEFAGHPRLGAAEYRLADNSKDRGVYSFCMCPGGHVVACSTENGQVVTNGMSYHKRDAQNSNSAIVVQVDERDFGSGALAALAYRDKIERAAYELGGGEFVAPATTVGDFLKNKPTKFFGDVIPSYTPGVKPVDISKCLPQDISMGLRTGINAFGRKLRGFDMPDAVMTAVESRTSAPVRILRNEYGQSISIKGLYPCGEGAGYAGGIVSAAVDGIRQAENLISRFAQPSF